MLYDTFRAIGDVGGGDFNDERGVLMIFRERCERAGINRHRVGDERALYERISLFNMAPSLVRVTTRLHVKR